MLFGKSLYHNDPIITVKNACGCTNSLIIPFHIGKLNIVTELIHNAEKGLIDDLFLAVDYPADIPGSRPEVIGNLRLRYRLLTLSFILLSNISLIPLDNYLSYK